MIVCVVYRVLYIVHCRKRAEKRAEKKRLLKIEEKEKERRAAKRKKKPLTAERRRLFDNAKRMKALKEIKGWKTTTETDVTNADLEIFAQKCTRNLKTLKLCGCYKGAIWGRVVRNVFIQ